MSNNFRFSIHGLVNVVELGPGDLKWEFIEDIRRFLLDTPRGEPILESMASFVDEAGGPALCLLAPPGVYACTQCTVGWMEKSVDEKKTEKMTIKLSSTICNTWLESLAYPKEPHILGAILTITVLHELVHVIRRVFCTTWTPEKLRGSRMPTAVPILDPAGQLIEVQRGEGGLEWKQSVLSEMLVAFEAGAVGNWTKVAAVGFTSNNRTQWIPKTDTQSIESVISLQLFSLKGQFRYDTNGGDAPPFPADDVVWRHGGATPLPADFSPTVSPSPSRNVGQILTLPRLPEPEARQALEDGIGMKVDIERPVCGTGQM
ncbi:hypothetical protein MVEN_02209900 [Mycena venus]|uniref:Uncharacterized protein n=1 Tax=Mycena venus TaxID=2733690 RepID=A0A8H7CFB4_9AGAR|nr:hypothetical protein MVEN_02209900 [Mycena venus]